MDGTKEAFPLETMQDKLARFLAILVFWEHSIFYCLNDYLFRTAFADFFVTKKYTTHY